MVKTVTRYETSDGTLFDTEQAAEEYEFGKEKRDIIRDYFEDDRYVCEFKIYEFIEKYTKGWK